LAPEKKNNNLPKWIPQRRREHAVHHAENCYEKPMIEFFLLQNNRVYLYCRVNNVETLKQFRAREEGGCCPALIENIKYVIWDVDFSS
jgi:hypothetical protein